MVSSETTFSIVTLVSIIFIIFYKYLTSEYNYWKKKGVEYISPNFPFGNFTDVFLLKISIGEFLRDIYNSSKSNLVGFWIFGKPYALVRTPELIKQILVSDFNHFADRAIESNEESDPVGAFLLLTMKNPEWKVMRQKMSPLFTTSKLKGMLPLVEASAADLNNFIKNSESVIESKELCAKFTTDVITSCAFGVDAGCFQNDNSPFRVAGRQMMSPSISNGFRFICYFLIPSFVRFFKLNFLNPTSTKFLIGAFWETIKIREKTKEERKDLIDKIIELKQQKDLGNGIIFEGNRVVAQAIQFFAAGFETTSNTLVFALYSLSNREDIQTNAREEIETTIRKYGGLTYEGVGEMKYLEKILCETMRMYPSLPFLDRRCVEDYKVPDTDVIIEKGTAVFISSFGIHYNPEFYPNPETFNPENFNEENIQKRPPCTFLPFGHGPHVCLGERFAMNSMKLALAYILKDFYVKRCSETITKINFNPRSFSVQPNSPMYLNYIRIKN